MYGRTSNSGSMSDRSIRNNRNVGLSQNEQNLTADNNKCDATNVSIVTPLPHGQFYNVSLFASQQNMAKKLRGLVVP